MLVVVVASALLLGERVLDVVADLVLEAEMVNEELDNVVVVEDVPEYFVVYIACVEDWDVD